VTQLHQDSATLNARIEVLEPLTPRVAMLEQIQGTLRKLPKGIPTKTRLSREPTPLQVVAFAQQDARIPPSELCYYGKSAECAYVWSPGRVFVVHVSSSVGTGIFLPPGETMVSGMYLDPDAFEVHSERAGVERLAYDAITIRPKGSEPKEIDCFILTASGRRYLFHLVNGAKAMLAVTFETPTITQGVSREPKLILPRPPQ
jgi:hypothetical protein